jgi:hypothetical protein
MFGKQKGVDDVFKAALLSMMTGNTNEHTEVNVHTQARVPLVQALLLAVGIVALLCGIWLLMGGLIAFAVSLGDRWAMLAGVAVLWAIAGAWAITGNALLAGKRNGIAKRFLLLFFMVTGTIATLDIARVVATGFDQTAGLQLLAGMSLTVAAALLVYRFANELVNPLYPRPPSIDLIRDLWQPGQGVPRVVRQPVPVYMNDKQVVADLTEDEPEEPLSDHELLMEFVARAAVIGLGRARWLNPDAPEYLGGREVTRGVYNTMVELAAKWRIVKRGGGGQPTDWIMDKAAAVEMLQTAWERVK